MQYQDMFTISVIMLVNGGDGIQQWNNRNPMSQHDHNCLHVVLFYEDHSDSCARAAQDVVSCIGC